MFNLTVHTQVGSAVTVLGEVLKIYVSCMKITIHNL